MNGRMSTSVLCAAAGTLCFFIPIPGASGVGGCLIGMAVANAATELMEMSDKNLKDQSEGKISENTKRILDQYGVKY